MAVLLKDAIAPNLVQTLENNPAFIHGGPFANIAHGCNSVIATKTALKLADYVVTEAGFGADLGAEKFFDIKCRKAGLKPDAAVVVATVRALKMHGGVRARPAPGGECRGARSRLRQPGAASRKPARLRRAGGRLGQPLQRRHRGRARQAEGAVRRARGRGGDRRPLGLWRRGRRAARRGRRQASPTSGEAKFQLLYPDEMPLRDKIKTIAQKIYRARDIACDGAVESRLAELQKGGFGHFPVCIAKTQYSFSTDANAKGAPSDHILGGARDPAVGRRRVHRRGLRRDHDDARPAARAGGQQHRPDRGRPDHRAVLSTGGRRIA